MLWGSVGVGRRRAGKISRQRVRSVILLLTRPSRKRKERTNALRPEALSQLTPFLHTVAQASQAVLLVDYDGTLAPFRAKRDQAYPYPGVAPLLQAIIRNGHTQVVVISGRDATDVLPLLNIHPHPAVWGIHGLQRLKTDGIMEIRPLDARTLTGLYDADRWLGDPQPRP